MKIKDNLRVLIINKTARVPKNKKIKIKKL